MASEISQSFHFQRTPCACACGSDSESESDSEKLLTVVEINHQWQRDYTELQHEFNALKMKLVTVEQRNDELEKENKMLSRQLGVVSFEESQHQQSFGHNDNSMSENQVSYSADEIAALKQQLVIYKEDFMQEKNELKRVSRDNNKLKSDLYTAQRTVDKLTQKNHLMKDNFRKVCYEKDHIMQELRKITMASSATSFTNVSAPANNNMSRYRATNNMGVINSYTLKPQRYGSEESLKSEDVIAHSPFMYKAANSYFCGGHVQKDGPCLPPLTQERPRST